MKKTKCLSVEIVSNKSKICIILVYNPPSTNLWRMDDLECLFERRQFHKPTYILGDLNWLKKSALKKNIEHMMN